MLKYIGRGIEYTGKFLQATGVLGMGATSVIGVAAVVFGSMLQLSRPNTHSRSNSSRSMRNNNSGFFDGFTMGMIWSDIFSSHRRIIPVSSSRVNHENHTAESSFASVNNLILFSAMIALLLILFSLVMELPIIALAIFATWTASIGVYGCGLALEVVGASIYEFFSDVTLNPLAYAYELFVDLKAWWNSPRPQGQAKANQANTNNNSQHPKKSAFELNFGREEPREEENEPVMGVVLATKACSMEHQSTTRNQETAYPESSASMLYRL